MIAGFPGETDEEHRATLDFIEGLPLAYLHVFSFSAREGTEAGKSTDTVADSAIHHRARELRALGEAKARAFRASQKGRALRVLTLDRKNRDWTPAITGNFLKVKLAGLWPRNSWMDIIFNESDAPLVPQRVEA